MRAVHAGAASMESLNMQNMLFYVVYSRHTSLVGSLCCKMIENVCEYYSTYVHVVAALHRLRDLLQRERVPHEVCVIIFFFFLSIDSRMRHWVLCSELSPEEDARRKKRLCKNVNLIPDAQAYLRSQSNAYFLGQTATFAPLDPHKAVAILLPISSEHFFEGITNGGGFDAFSETFQRIKHLVACA